MNEYYLLFGIAMIIAVSDIGNWGVIGVGIMFLLAYTFFTKQIKQGGTEK